MSATVSGVDGAQVGSPPDGDRVHECSAEGCEAWRYSWLALQFHQLREHDLPDYGSLTDE